MKQLVIIDFSMCWNVYVKTVILYIYIYGFLVARILILIMTVMIMEVTAIQYVRFLCGICQKKSPIIFLMCTYGIHKTVSLWWPPKKQSSWRTWAHLGPVGPRCPHVGPMNLAAMASIVLNYRVGISQWKQRLTEWTDCYWTPRCICNRSRFCHSRFLGDMGYRGWKPCSLSNRVGFLATAILNHL